MVGCLKEESTAPPSGQGADSDTHTLNDETFDSMVRDTDAHTVVAPHLISKYERQFYYHGLSGAPPELLYRSDLETNPFPIPPPGTRFFQIPYKTAGGVFGTLLNDIWDDKVAPLVLAELKKHGIKWSAFKTARFTTVADGKSTRGPIVLWIAVRPNTTNAEALRDVTPHILRIFSEFQIMDIVVEWYEGEVSRLSHSHS